MTTPPNQGDVPWHWLRSCPSWLHALARLIFGLIVIFAVISPIVSPFISVESNKWAQQLSAFEATNGSVAKMLVGAGYDTKERSQYQTFLFCTRSDGFIPRLVSFHAEGNKVSVDQLSFSRSMIFVFLALASWAIVFWYSFRFINRKMKTQER